MVNGWNDYTYACLDCNCEYVIEERIVDDRNTKPCPHCSSCNTESVIGGSSVIVYGNPTTIGQLNDQNTRRMGTYQKEKILHDRGELNVKTPEWKKLVGKSKAEVQKYIDG